MSALDTSVDIIKTGDYMSRFCSNLSLPLQIHRAATYIANKAEELGILSGKSPISIAAAAIYLASQVGILYLMHNDKKK